MYGKVKDFLDDPLCFIVYGNRILDFRVADIAQRGVGKDAIRFYYTVSAGPNQDKSDYLPEVFSRFWRHIRSHFRSVYLPASRSGEMLGYFDAGISDLDFNIGCFVLLVAGYLLLLAQGIVHAALDSP